MVGKNTEHPLGAEQLFPGDFSIADPILGGTKVRIEHPKLFAVIERISAADERGVREFTGAALGVEMVTVETAMEIRPTRCTVLSRSRPCPETRPPGRAPVALLHDSLPFSSVFSRAWRLTQHDSSSAHTLSRSLGSTQLTRYPSDQGICLTRHSRRPSPPFNLHGIQFLWSTGRTS